MEKICPHLQKTQYQDSHMHILNNTATPPTHLSHFPHISSYSKLNVYINLR